MGKWKKQAEWSQILHMISEGRNLHEIYQREYERGYTFDDFHGWVWNLKTAIYFKFGLKLEFFYPKILKQKSKRCNNNSTNNKPKDLEIFAMTNENLSILNDVLTFKDGVLCLDFVQLEECTKKYNIKLSEINYWKYLAINERLKLDKKASLLSLCKVFDLARSTYYYLQNKEASNRMDANWYKRKLRKDAKIYSQDYKDKILEMMEYIKNISGCRKLSKMITHKYPELHISGTTVWKILTMNGMSTNPGKYYKKKNYREMKDTSILRENILKNPVVIDNAEPLSIISTDYCVLKNEKHGHVHLIAAIDPKTHYILFAKVVEKQSAKAVVDMLKSLPKKPAIIHSDNKAEFTSKMTKEYCFQHNIQQSFSRPGKSTDNRWNEYHFGRLQIEYLNYLDYPSMTIRQLNKVIKEYVDIWNNRRLNEKFNWESPTHQLNHKD